MKHAVSHTPNRHSLGIAPLAVMGLLALLVSAFFPSHACADTLTELYGTPLNRVDFFESSDGAILGDKGISLMSSAPRARAAAHVEPMDLSEGMLSHLKYESGQNYDQGLSAGDGYHALGYFQFDNRYTLGPFLEAVYAYDPATYAPLKLIQDRYGWDVTGPTREDDSFTQLGNDLNSAWHACYAANPTEFSQLQNYWAYESYYAGPDGTSGSLSALGIDIDSRPDIIRGLCWGITSLFGPGGGASAINQGNYWGANWFFKNSGISDSMSDVELATTLCTYIVDHVAERYPNQPEYWEGWQRRYRLELEDCLAYLGEGGSGTQKPTTQQMWRLYNPYTGEHLYTADGNEYASLGKIGWRQEGVAWLAPASSGDPVWRLYNPYSGDHHYTMNIDEYAELGHIGWVQEGVAWRSAGKDGAPVYRLFNPYETVGTHHYTTSKPEYDTLANVGWVQEGVAWYGIG